MAYSVLPLLLWLEGGREEVKIASWVGFSPSGAAGGGFVAVQKRIIGGQPCERVYHIKLRGVTADGSANLCGGSLITERWIVTAAHCLHPQRVRIHCPWLTCLPINDIVPKPMTMFALFRDQEQVEITEKPLIYTDKDQKGNDRTHDIMLLKLPSSSSIEPLDLPVCSTHPLKVEIAGHAATSGGPNNERRPGVSPILHCAYIDIVSCENLRITLQTHFPHFYDVMQYQHWFCGQTPGMDICRGDSGGGVVYDNKIYGIISFLGDPKKVYKKPSGFMDLCHSEYNTWIRNTIS